MKVFKDQFIIKRGKITSFYNEETMKLALRIFEDVMEALKEEKMHLKVYFL